MELAFAESGKDRGSSPPAGGGGKGAKRYAGPPSPARLWRAILAPVMMEAFLEPGMLVRHPGEPDWGVGQVQSVDGRRVTVTFEEAGKRVIDIQVVQLDYVGPDPRRDTGA